MDPHRLSHRGGVAVLAFGQVEQRDGLARIHSTAFHGPVNNLN